MTLPAFRASRIDLDVIECLAHGLPLWARTVQAIHLLGVNRSVTTRETLALDTGAFSERHMRQRAAVSNFRINEPNAVLPTMTPTAFGMPTVAPLIRDGPSHSQFWDQYARAHARQWGVTRPVGRPTGRRHADGARAFNNSRAHLTRGPMRICRVCVEPGRRWGGGSDRYHLAGRAQRRPVTRGVKI